MHGSISQTIHPTAIVAPKARIASDAHIGPYAVIGPDVEIGPGATIGSHTVIEGNTRIGSHVHVAHFVSIGTPPQDMKYKGEPTKVEIGDESILREFVSVHRGTVDGGGITRIGRSCLLMAYCHVAHDCQIGDQVVMANGVTLGGHVVVEEHAIIGGLSAIHQFCCVGAYAFLGGMSGTNKDIPPYVKFWGQRGNIYGLNLVGLRRHGFTRETIEALRHAYRRLIRRNGTIRDSLNTVEAELGHIPEVRHFVDFIRTSQRGIPTAGSEDEQD